MADEYKKQQHHNGCLCCNGYEREQQKLRRLVRHQLKQKDDKEFKMTNFDKKIDSAQQQAILDGFSTKGA